MSVAKCHTARKEEVEERVRRLELPVVPSMLRHTSAGSDCRKSSWELMLDDSVEETSGRPYERSGQGCVGSFAEERLMRTVVEQKGCGNAWQVSVDAVRLFEEVERRLSEAEEVPG